jgi:predicted RND superfamily exporter protein
VETLGILNERLARWAMAHGRALAWLAVVITLVSGAIGLPPKVDSNLLNLLPDSEPTVQAIRKINDQEGGLNLLTLTLRSEDPAKLDAALSDLQRRFEALPDVEFAMHKVEEDLALHVGLLQFTPGELSELNTRLKGALALGPALNPFVMQRLMAMGPLTERIEKASKSALVGAKDGQGKLFVRPSGTASDAKFAQAFMLQVEEVLAEADLPSQDVQLAWMGGAYRHTVEDVKGIQWDLTWTTFVSAGLVLLILVISFRSLSALVIVFPPLIVANAVNLAWVKLYMGTLNTYTAFGTAMLFGLGIDFAVHLVGRYREERAAGLGPEDAVAEAWRVTGPPCGIAAGTSIAGFLALGIAEFGGFVQLGMLLAGGLALCLVANLVLLPPLILRFERYAPPLLGTSVGEVAESKSSYASAPYLAAALLVGTTVLSALILPRLDFEFDLSSMRRDGQAYDELSADEQTLARESYSPVVASYPSGGTMAEDQVAVRAAIADGKMPHVAAVVSIRDVLPPDQDARNAQIAELATLMALPNVKYLPPVLQQRLAPVAGVKVEAITREMLPEGVRHLLGATNSDVERMLILPKGNMWDVREARALKAELEEVLPGRELAGEHIGVAAMFLIALRDAPRIGGLALVLVLVFLLWDLRKPSLVFAAFASLVVGVAWAGIAMWLGGVKLSMINIAAIPILLGIGVDVIVHLSHRLAEEGPGGIRRSLRTTGTAVTISTLTTMGSFGSLVLAGNRGVRSLGLLVVLGLTMVGVMGTLTLFSLWAAGWRQSGRSPAQAAEKAPR